MIFANLCNEVLGSSSVWPIGLVGAAEQKHPHLAIASGGAGHADILALKLIGIVDGEHCGQCLGHIDASLGRHWLDLRCAADMGSEIIDPFQNWLAGAVNWTEM